MRAIKPSLWFDGNLEEAVEFYTTLFPNSLVGDISRYGPDQPGPEGSVMAASFTLNGMGFTAINGGPQFPFTEAVSFVIECEDQAELDHYWDALTADGGQEVQCGWLKDRFGLSWQVVPADLAELLSSDAAVQAMLGMKKLVIADLVSAG